MSKGFFCCAIVASTPPYTDQIHRCQLQLSKDLAKCAKSATQEPNHKLTPSQRFLNLNGVCAWNTGPDPPLGAVGQVGERLVQDVVHTVAEGHLPPLCLCGEEAHPGDNHRGDLAHGMMVGAILGTELGRACRMADDPPPLCFVQYMATEPTQSPSPAPVSSSMQFSDFASGAFPRKTRTDASSSATIFIHTLAANFRRALVLEKCGSKVHRCFLGTLGLKKTHLSGASQQPSWGASWCWGVGS